MRTCPILDAEENVLFVFVADSGQVSDCSRQVAAFLTAQHSTELDDALERHVINFTHTHIHQMATPSPCCRVGNNTVSALTLFLVRQ